MDLLIAAVRRFVKFLFSDGLLGNYRMVRNTDSSSSLTCVFTGEKQTYDQSKFIPVPVKRGEIIVLCIWRIISLWSLKFANVVIFAIIIVCTSVSSP